MRRKGRGLIAALVLCSIPLLKVTVSSPSHSIKFALHVLLHGGVWPPQPINLVDENWSDFHHNPQVRGSNP